MKETPSTYYLFYDTPWHALNPDTT